MELVTRYFSFDEVTADQGWQLLSWCRRHGANEFTLEALVTGKQSARMQRFFERLNPHAQSSAPRRLLSAPVGSSFIRDVPLWKLTPLTEELLREAWIPSFISHAYDADLWLEDLAVYRDAELMMAVLSHEDGGILRVTQSELDELRQLGFPDRDQVPWIGY
jgi:hypothetical protein